MLSGTWARVEILDGLADRLAEAAMGRSGDDAVRATMHAYRDYTKTHPRRYAALPQPPGTDPETVRAGNRAVDAFLTVLRAYGLGGSDAIHVTRGLRAAAPGFVSPEIAGGFGLPEKLEDSYDDLVTALITGLRERTAR
jgi:WHG domain-containing protein